MYRKLAIACGAVTALIFLAYCGLELLDKESQFAKDYGYTLGLILLPFCCGLAPATGVLTIVFGILSLSHSRQQRNRPNDSRQP